jgi:uncharacterized protein YfaS (alpha-2-macroglobulin family)
VAALPAVAALAATVSLATPAHAVTVQTQSPQGEVARVRQARVTFSASMVALGDPRLPAPYTVRCEGEGNGRGTGRWVDDRTWVFDFLSDVPAGTRCQLTVVPGLKARNGEALTGEGAGGRDWRFSTGGPAIVRAYPSAGTAPGDDGDDNGDGRFQGGEIEEEQVFALLLNGPATQASVERHAHCEASGVAEQLPVRVVTGPPRDDILQTLHLKAQQARVLMLQCARPLPPEARVQVVWGPGIATPGGVAVSPGAGRTLYYKVRPGFSASFSCERVNARANCLPIRPLRVEFSSPVPRKLAEAIVLETPDGTRHPLVEQHRGETQERLGFFNLDGVRRWFLSFTRKAGEVAINPDESAVSAVQFEPGFAEHATLRIVLPSGFHDDAGRPLVNAASYPLQVQTAEAPPLAKFPRAVFGVLELKAEPTLPLTVRHVEGDLDVKGLNVLQPAPKPGPDLGRNQATQKLALSDLTVREDADIIRWFNKLRRYDETRLLRTRVEAELGVRLPPPVPKPVTKAPDERMAKRYGRDVDEEARAAQAELERRWVQSRSVSLLAREGQARRLQLPPVQRTEPHPFEVVGIPMPEPGFHVVEVASPRLGQALLDRAAPLYVRTSVLVTNLGVHLKLGTRNALVWVTTLDQGRPVAGAAVRISDCRGRPVWSGRTDAQGLARVEQALPPLYWYDCQGHGRDEDGEGNEGVEGGEGGPGNQEGYFVSARHTDEQGRADMAFVWSSWNDGIEAWRFHVPTDNTADTDPVRWHTVFDRTLLRAGQTVSMQHHARIETLRGLRLPRPNELPDVLILTHEGSGQTFRQPLQWRQGRVAESTFAIPQDAKLGVYTAQLRREARGTVPERTVQTGQFRVEAFRLPVMTGQIQGPKAVLVQPKTVPIGVQIRYGNGGGAAALPVRVSAQVSPADAGSLLHAERYPGFAFAPPRAPRDAAADEGRDPFDEDFVDEDDEASALHRRGSDARLVADKLALTLDGQGQGQVTLSPIPAAERVRELLVQATYADPNGEVQTLSQTMPVWPSAVVLGLRTDRWVSVRQKVATQVLALDTTGRPQAGVAVRVRAVVHRTTSTRKRLVGGFYAYDNQQSDEDLGEVCRGSSDARGLVLCEVQLQQAGEIELIAEATDAAGHPSRSAASVWVTRQGELWFGGDNQDRMDVIPEQRRYEPGQQAVFQVRSPFREATALVAIERNGILESFTVTLHGDDPTLRLPVKAEWGPNVFVSVFAVRGRIHEVPWYSFFTWGWRSPTEWWRAYRDAGASYQAPTAMVDLSKPAFKYGLAEIEVGTASRELKVTVQPDRERYPVRATSQVRVKVLGPDGRPVPAGTEVALAAVDEALLELQPNDSWDLLHAMLRERGYGVETATAQMQIIGKRHYGKKAVPAGGGGGDFPTRELFDTLLLWQPRVVLDAKGEATVAVPLNDALTRFRIVVVAAATRGDDAALFGTGQASITATQDLQILSGVPPLVREGDHYRALFTLRNTTGQPMDVEADAHMGTGDGSALPAQRLHIAPNAAAELNWDVQVPFNVRALAWQVSARSAGAQDRMAFQQEVAEAMPVTVQQATLMQLDGHASVPVAAPAEALRDAAGVRRGGIDVGLKPTLGDGLPGVRRYFEDYLWGCLEQRASIAIGLRDTALWDGLMQRLPLYLDDDGLAHYFPPGPGMAHQGSDALTAYLLSISDEATRLGQPFVIPEAARDKMARGLIAFVEGRIQRNFWRPAFLKNGDLDVRKLAALEALSRTGQVRARMLDTIQILPNQWPTGAVIDWLMVLERVKDLPQRAQRLQEAEQVLRARLNVQGTRLGFSTERDDNWWWLMANADVNSTRMIVAALDLPGWRDDLPRLVVGTLQRQQRGHWSTTVANAWGSVAMSAFAKRFETTPVSGQSQAGFVPGGPQRSWAWADKGSGGGKEGGKDGGTLSLGWPTDAAVKDGSATLQLTHDGAGKPWVTLTSRAAVPLKAAFSSGLRITRSVTPVEQQTAGRFTRGDVLRVHLDVDVQADATWVVLNDPIPAGATVLGNGLGRDNRMATEGAEGPDGGEQQDDRVWLAYQERRFDAFRAYYRYVPKGRFSVEYTVRLNNPGTFGMPATRVEAMYAPEMFGEWPNAPVVVAP